MIPLLHTAISERFRGAARRSAIQIHVYFTVTADNTATYAVSYPSNLHCHALGQVPLDVLEKCVCSRASYVFDLHKITSYFQMQIIIHS